MLKKLKDKGIFFFALFKQIEKNLYHNYLKYKHSIVFLKHKSENWVKTFKKIRIM